MIRIEIMCNICMAIEIFINCFEKEKGYIYIKKCMTYIYTEYINLYIHIYTSLNNENDVFLFCSQSISD